MMDGDERRKPLLTGEFRGPVATEGGEAADLRGSQGAIYRPVFRTRSELEELNDYLAHAIAAYETRTYQYLRPPASPPSQPYKFLYAFEIEDAPLFCGRDAVADDLLKTVLTDRLTILHAKSGAGKTSLLKAGLCPRLIREGRLPVYARAYRDPCAAIKEAILFSSRNLRPKPLLELSLQQFLALVCKHLDHNTRELVIILDQFEEFFVFRPELDHRLPFVNALANCYEDTSLPVRFVISIRGDYFTELGTFQNRLPHIFHNTSYLNSMTREQVRDAIIKPVGKLSQPIAYEADLVDELLNDLFRGGLRLPHLQIVCTRLYSKVDERLCTIARTAYAELGKADGILAGYLHAVLEQLPIADRTVARNIFTELVSSEATKRVLPLNLLRAKLGSDPEELARILSRLVAERLLQRDEGADEPTYEIAHEYLVSEIEGWITRDDLAQKRIEELVEREVASWRIHGSLIPTDRLDLMFAQRSKLCGLSDEAWNCIVSSALHALHQPMEWVKVAGPRAVKPLLVSMTSRNWSERERAGLCLHSAVDCSSVELLIPSFNICDYYWREIITEAIVKVGLCAVEPLIGALGTSNKPSVAGVVDALGRLGDARAVEPLAALLTKERSHLAQTVAIALGKLGDTRAVEPLIALLTDNVQESRERPVDISRGQADVPTADSLIVANVQKDYRSPTTADEVFSRGLLQEVGSNVPVPAAPIGKETRAAVCEALGKIADSRAMGPLVVALGDESGEVRMKAACALAVLGDGHAVESLASRLCDEYAAVRWASAMALGRICDPRATKPLASAVRDNSKHVRYITAWALGAVGLACAELRNAGAWTDHDESLRQGVGVARDGFECDCILESLTQALRDENTSVRKVATQALCHIGYICQLHSAPAFSDSEEDYSAFLPELEDRRRYLEPPEALLADFWDVW